MESSGLLDETGKKLLSIVQKDARISYAELGRQIGLSPAAAAERLHRMEEAGIIKGYRVDIDREALGFTVLAIVRMSCDGAKYRPFLKAVKTMDYVAECHHVAGEDAFILKVVTGSVDELERLVEKLLEFGVPTTSIVFSSPVLGQMSDLPARYWSRELREG
jgi:Lrp/AsnC family transcriptional regulator, leucine-responsive regulatory protein